MKIPKEIRDPILYLLTLIPISFAASYGTHFYLGLVIKSRILFVGILILLVAMIPVFMHWRQLKKFLGRYSWELYFIFCYTGFAAILGFSVFDLKNETDRVWFQGLIALGLVLILFIEFTVDYRNRKRNVVYGKQIDSLLDFSKIIQDARMMLQEDWVEDNWNLKKRLDNLGTENN